MNPSIQKQFKALVEEALVRDLPSPGADRAQLHVVGLNHTRAALAQRECYALAPEQCAGLIRQFHEKSLARQVLVLSTCNRTELYAFSDRPQFARQLRAAFLAIGGQDGDAPLYEYAGLDAARHLFAVGAGLDSLILGENQIKQQLQQAYALSRAERACGPELNRLLEAALRAGKRIRTETDLNVGTLCVGKAAVLKAEQVLGSLTGKVCLVIGAGKVGRLAARALAERHPGRLWIVNRTVATAGEIATDLGAEAYGLESLACLLPEADFILGAAYAPELLLSRTAYERARQERPRREAVCLIDAALPRIIDPALGDLAGVSLFDIEHMQEITEENRQRRTVAAQTAWRIVDEEVALFRTALQTAELAPLIRRLRRRFDGIFEEEIGQVSGHFSPEIRSRYTATLQRLKQRLLHEAIQEIKTHLLD